MSSALHPIKAMLATNAIDFDVRFKKILLKLNIEIVDFGAEAGEVTLCIHDLRAQPDERRKTVMQPRINVFAQESDGLGDKKYNYENEKGDYAVYWEESDDSIQARILTAIQAHSPKRCIIVEDEEEIALRVKKIVESLGIEPVCANSLSACRAQMSRFAADLLLVDRMLPDGDGLDFVKDLRRRNFSIPAIIITALNKAQQVAEGLNTGANDYIRKPFDPDELSARIQAILRPHIDGDVQMFGRLEIQRANGIAKWNRRLLALQRKEFEILEYLARREDIFIPKSMMQADIWGVYRQHTPTNIVASGVRRLRRALKASAIPEIIFTKGDSYAFSSKPLLLDEIPPSEEERSEAL